MDNYLELEEFCALTHLSSERVQELIDEGKLKSATQEGKLFIEATSGANAIIARNKDGLVVASGGVDTGFVEKTIGTILGLHEKVLEAKDESLVALRGENQFLREALFSMQEVYDEDRKTLKTLRDQLKIAQEEMESMKRKYRLMWGKVADLSPKESGEGKE
ncbi:MAG: DUF3972 domain-containing protein [Wolinella sp.]